MFAFFKRQSFSLFDDGFSLLMIDTERCCLLLQKEDITYEKDQALQSQTVQIIVVTKVAILKRNGSQALAMSLRISTRVSRLHCTPWTKTQKNKNEGRCW